MKTIAVRATSAVLVFAATAALFTIALQVGH
jgi:hypothetical protein